MGKTTAKMTEIKSNIKTMKEHMKKGPTSYGDAYACWKLLKTQSNDFNVLVRDWEAKGHKTKKVGGAVTKMDTINRFTAKVRDFVQRNSQFWDNPKTKR